jgi:hypothetical protein
MLRRVARILRACLIVVAMLVLAWIPASCYCRAVVDYMTPDRYRMLIVCEFGALTFNSQPGASSFYGPGTHYAITAPDPAPVDVRSPAIYPQVHFNDGLPGWTTVSLPLWLLAFLCLAWPVTSFVIARRRRGTRGFEVEAVGGNAVPTVDS